MSDFLGTGWRFPIAPDSAGRLSYAHGEESIAHCLRALLLTGLGERVMRPDLGTRAPGLVFAPDSTTNLGDLEDSIRDAVRLFEPRVELETVRAEASPGDEGRVTVTIAYRVRRTNTRANLVFPFYLGLTGGRP
ncbi:phage baseplate assembly protein W [Catenuloplanes nepalensis]|uniref:Phage baseplate assembly protein W n=1 Tax=Catenuloplanes nepalensis TaxID=587533 RepID=A0ABT9MP33_9ACTN|nr:GPW/gp25 family protein [Catenuloplanes nepalensis]MDP9793190.1 phage baseplate assembly protein W [Catenuloplanes nepalensis]